MRSCEEYEALISAFIDGELSQPERAELMEHMSGCAVCQRYFDDQIAIHDLLGGLEEVPAPEGLAGRVMERVRETPQDVPARKKRLYLPHWQRWGALAACCALLALGAWGLRERGGTKDVMQASVTADAIPAIMEDAMVMRSAEAGAPLAESEYDCDAPAGEAEDALTEPQAEAFAAPPASAQEITGSGSMRDGADQCKEYQEPEAPMDDAIFEDGLFSDAPTLTTGSALARQWVEEHLESAWISGGCYRLTEEEYLRLRELLEDAGEAFSETPGSPESALWLLAAE